MPRTPSTEALLRSAYTALVRLELTSTLRGESALNAAAEAARKALWRHASTSPGLRPKQAHALLTTFNAIASREHKRLLAAASRVAQMPAPHDPVNPMESTVCTASSVPTASPKDNDA